MNINLNIHFRGRDLLLTMDIINMSFHPADVATRESESLAHFEIEEIFVATCKGMRLPSARLDKALYDYIMLEYADEISESVLMSC